ncbi:type II toxin-antitoxin system PemK/MazF family toxin [Candidatus Synechococcus spongiarum]|uniref:type II toxin-antitoxin system PemK/MazF family toxin n=1 Tax=Candidatus Synechococcus spongiarum TaxID=431041 RepID=UPI001C5AD455
MLAFPEPRQCEIWVASLDGAEGSEMQKARPVAVVSPDFMNDHLETVVICPLTSKLHRDWPSRLQIVCAGRDSEVAVD